MASAVFADSSDPCFSSTSTPTILNSDGTASNCQQEVYRNGINYFDVAIGSANCVVGVSTSADGSNNQQIVYNYFFGKAVGDQTINAYQAAAIDGNFGQESTGSVRVDPTAQQDNSTSPTPKSGVGFGIAQWSTAGRQAGLVALAKKDGKPATDLGVQLDYVWQELNAGYKNALTQLLASKDIASATTNFEKYYEAAGDPNNTNRINFAKDDLQAYGGGAAAQSDQGTGDNVVPADSSGDCSTTDPGQATKFANLGNFTIYSQYDKRWANNAYGTSTIADSGCGPAAMAMIITALTGQAVTPADTTKYANTQNIYISGSGSSWSVAPVLAKHWGLTATQIGADVAKITTTLESGGLVIGSGTGALPFSQDGHYIVIRGIAADGKWLIGNSAFPQTNSEEWSPQQLMATMGASAGSIYAITAGAST